MNDFKLMSYNIHKGKSFLTRKRVFQELHDIIHTINADIVFLQEVRDYHSRDYEIYQKNQLDFLSNNQYHWFYGKNSEYKSGHHGNAILSKYPILETKNFDLTVNKLEKRGVLFNRLEINEQNVYTFCTHLNLRKTDRQKQIVLLENIINEVVKDKKSKVILVGDFNDFDNSIEKYFKHLHFNLVEGQKTFPNFFPMLSLDKVFTKNAPIVDSYVLKNKTMIQLSDHLPIISRIEICKS